jgi:hypothetical protein
MTNEPVAFTIENFYKFIKEDKLMAAECTECGKLLSPPRPMCSNCHSKKLKWRELKKRGKLLAYTVIHIAPQRFQQLTPYPVGIVELEDGGQLPGMIKNSDLTKIRIGMNLAVDFSHEPVSEQWPQWSRYYFIPIE